MSGRALISEGEARARGFGGPACARRRLILRETLEAFSQPDQHGRYQELAQRNLARWREAAGTTARELRVAVYREDWGEATHRLTREYGLCFAVLNMANAYVPGGAYVEGAAAQEENMFRRTDCHLRIDEGEYDPRRDRYVPAMTGLLSARNGLVYLDRDRPRVCIRGPEDPSRNDLGYRWLPESEVFPFYELRAAARDLRDGSPFDPADMRRRISAQMDTLRQRGIRHAVLSAFGCGAFENPADRVAQIYAEEICARRTDLSAIAFAVFWPGYGPDNYLLPFARTFGID